MFMHIYIAGQAAGPNGLKKFEISIFFQRFFFNSAGKAGQISMKKNVIVDTHWSECNNSVLRVHCTLHNCCVFYVH